jgi:hypothetical protein
MNYLLFGMGAIVTIMAFYMYGRIRESDGVIKGYEKALDKPVHVYINDKEDGFTR